MDQQLEVLVWERARHRCEYCHFPSAVALLSFQIDHIIAQKHEGTTESENLALACFYCNSYKGTNLAGIDPVTGQLVRLFHPRRDVWRAHFSWTGPVLHGVTGIGRVTIAVLRINHPDAIAVRQALLAEGRMMYLDR